MPSFRSSKLIHFHWNFTFEAQRDYSAGIVGYYWTGNLNKPISETGKASVSQISSLMHWAPHLIEV